MTGLAAGWDHRTRLQDHAGDTEHDVELLLAFLNTRDLELGTDVLDGEATWRAWVSERGLGRWGNPEQAREVRAALRCVLGDEHESGRPGTLGLIRVDLSSGVPLLATGDALGAVLAASARLAVLGSWERVKVCSAEGCGRAFFDRSRNRSRTWCSMQVCGNREKARNWRERARSVAAS
nr:CGNR zinc finger domain-containing protein [Umezawaea beigongshangensis]